MTVQDMDVDLNACSLVIKLVGTLSVLLPLLTKGRSHYEPWALPVTRHRYSRHALHFGHYLNLNTSRKIGIAVVDEVDDAGAFARRLNAASWVRTRKRKKNTTTEILNTLNEHRLLREYGSGIGFPAKSFYIKVDLMLRLV
jgi:hypothetical protein